MQVCRGGIGSRDLRRVNKALMAKPFWRIVEKTDSIVIMWVNHKYMIAGTGFLFKRSTLQSTVWKGVASNVEFIRRDLRWQMGNGSNIDSSSRIWPWQWRGQRGACTVADLLNDRKDA